MFKSNHDKLWKIQIYISQTPTDLVELAEAIETYDHLMSEIESTEKTFPPITDQMNTLGKKFIIYFVNLYLT